MNGSDLLPRQPMRAVPYAFGLVPGAEIEGVPEGSTYALQVRNLGTDSNDSGIYARGEKWGLYAEEVGENSDVGIHSPDFVEAKGYRSFEDSYLFVPGTAAVLYPSSGCTLWTQIHGSARLECSTAGTKHIYIPVTVPGILFGQTVSVNSVRVHYDLDSSGSYIDRTVLYKQTAAGQSVTIFDDGTNRTSTSPTSYSLNAVDNNALGLYDGVLNLYLMIYHDGDIGHDVNVGGLRMRLQHTD